jgi:hypothetical protein
VAAVVIAFVPPAMAQDTVRVDGIVQRLFGQDLTVISDVPSAPVYVIQGGYLVPVPGPRPVISVDLGHLRQSRVTATSIVRAAQ